MLSGNGRHRRPRQAPAFLVTAGVTSAGVALPLLGAGAAGAVEGETWDRVAECESGGDWLADGENGYFGGLQLPLGMWLEYGGEEFADRPDLASRSQQIAVAERILADRGPRAFPGCALLSGLRAEYRAEREAAAREGGTDGAGEEPADASGDSSAGTPAAPRDPDGAERDAAAPEGADGTERADGSAGSAGEDRAGDGSGAEAGDDAGDAGHGAAGDGSARDGGPGGGSAGEEAAGGDRAERDGSASPGGRHRGAPAPEEETGREGERSGGGRHAAREGVGADGGRGADGFGYRVRPGDSLSGIAGERSLPGGWPALYERNADVVGADPDYILPGQLLDLGPAPGDASGAGASGGEASGTPGDATGEAGETGDSGDGDISADVGDTADSGGFGVTSGED